jgi:hypothetical protein
VHLAARGGKLPLAGDLTPARILGRRLQSRGLDAAGHLGRHPPSLGPGPDDAVAPVLQVAPVHLDAVVR